MLDRIIKFFTSLRLTVVCLAFAVLLVFFGTLAQVNEGLYDAQNRWFRSIFVWWGPAGAGWIGAGVVGAWQVRLSKSPECPRVLISRPADRDQSSRDLPGIARTSLRGLKEDESPVSCGLYTRRPRSLRRCDPNPA